MRHKILISMAIATLFAMSACSDDDSSSTPNNPPAPPVTDLCAGKVAGATCDTGKTCQDEGGKLVCRVPEHEGIGDATQWACGTNICS